MGARRSQRRAVRYKQDQSGCMWGLISMFDFRHGRTPRKLITEKKHGTKNLSGPAILKNKFDLLRNLGENREGVVEGEESSGSNKPSVKKLIEEEMVNEQCPKRERGDSAVVEPKLEDDEEDRLRSVIKKAKKTRKKSRDMDTHPNPECSCKQNNADLQSVSGPGIDEIMAEFSRQIHQKGIISSCVKDGPNGEARELLRNGSDFEEKLRAAIMEFIVQRITNNGKKLEEDEDQRTQRSSSELMNEPELVGSDEELFLKLVQDSESMFVKYVQNLKDDIPPEQKLVDARKSEEDLISNHKHRSLFRRKVIKSHEKNTGKENSHLDDLNRIVILKPGPLLRSYENDGSRDTIPNKEAGHRYGSSNFFLSEIKRRLKNTMGKQNHEAPSRAEASNKRQTKRCVLDIGGDAKGNIGINSPTKDHFYIERNPKPRGPKTSKHESGNTTNNNNNGLPNKERTLNIYIKAKKHLSELLSSGDGLDLSSRKNPKTLGRILSLPEYGASPVGSPSPGRDWEQSFVGSRTRFSSEDKGQAESSSPPKESTEAEKLEKSQTSVSEDTVWEVEGEETATKDEPSLEEDSNRVKEENFVLDRRPGEPYGSSSPRMDEQSGSVPVIFDDRESHFTVFRQDSNEEKLSESSPPGSPLDSLIAKDILDNEITLETPERPSPVSVLEPIFSEDDISPQNTTFEILKLTLQPLRIQFEEPDSSRPTTDENPEGKGFSDDEDVIFGFMKHEIQASGLDWEQICVKLLSSDQLLENPSSLGELYPNRLCSDVKLLLDCMNEVLVELCLYHFGSSPWVSFTKPTITPAPSLKSIALETFKGVHRHLLPLPLPRTLEQIVRKDMEKSGTWLDARFETEIVGFEMSEAIFEDLFEESIFGDLVVESMLCYVRANKSIEVEPKESQVS